MAAGGQGGVGRDAHQPDVAATEHEADAGFCQAAAQFICGCAITLIGADR
jgi:hypothetical protein